MKKDEIVIEGSISSCQDIDEVMATIKEKLMDAIDDDAMEEEELLDIVKRAMRHIAAAKYEWVRILKKPEEEFDEKLVEYTKEADKLMRVNRHKAQRMVHEWTKEEMYDADDNEED
jgi:uncharacterized damage-inducible protein DinB